jgi:predicted nucleic acid-binding protein
MFILDTNVVSELRKAGFGKADVNVAGWMRAVAAGSLFLSAITIMELEIGVRIMERRDERQGRALRGWLDARVVPVFQDRIFPVDTVVARRCAALHVPDRRSDRDALIAATALVHGMTVVTRNVADFVDSGVPTINPWIDRAKA